jgi:hypothetical protein
VNFGTPANSYTTMTFAMWIRSTQAGYTYPLSKYDYNGSAEFGYLCRVNPDGTLSWRLLRNGGALVLNTRSAVVNDDAWHHLAGTVSNNTANANENVYTLYLDGIQVDQSNVNFVLQYYTNSCEVIGAAYEDIDGAFSFWSGKQDDVRIYNRDLSSNQVYTLFTNAPSTVRGP